MKKLKWLFLVVPTLGFSQSKIDPAKFKVFNPDENSHVYNEIYTQNFFFGNFGLKQIIKAIPINYQNVKSIKVLATNDTQKNAQVMELFYDKDGKLTQMKINDNLMGEALDVNYVYENGVIKEENINTEDGKKSNKFFYTEGKMIIENVKGVLDIYNRRENVLYKTSYLDGNLVFMDRLEGKCRVTQYRKQDINKVCFSNFKLEQPLTIDEFTTSEDTRGNLVLQKDKQLDLKQIDEFNYAIYKNKIELYKVALDSEMRLKSFDFHGIKSEHVRPISFSFTYTYYK